VKPIDTQTLVAAVAASGDRVVVVEDHYRRVASAARCSKH
jgi:hypothetical protein